MSVIRILTVFASIVVLAVMLALVYNGPASSGFSEIITLFLVLGLTALLGFLTYDPVVMWHHFVRVGFKDKKGRDPFAKRMVAQLALYALISGIIIAILQILSVSGQASEMEKKLALWSLLYGVLTAVGLWVISGLDKPGSSRTTEKITGDENQVILAFCVLLLTVGVLSLLFIEMQKVGRPQILIEATKLNTGLQLGDDMIWRPATFFQEDSAGDPPAQPLKIAGGGKKPRKDNTQVAVKPSEAVLRWELNLDSRFMPLVELD